MLSKWTPGGAQGQVNRPTLGGSTFSILLHHHTIPCSCLCQRKTEIHDMNCFTCLLENLDESSLVTFVTLSKEVLLHNAWLLCLSATRAWGRPNHGRPTMILGPPPSNSWYLWSYGSRVSVARMLDRWLSTWIPRNQWLSLTFLVRKIELTNWP